MQRLSVALRSEVSGNQVAGHAAVFGQYAQLPGHLETLGRDAFKRALAEDQDVRLLVNHDPRLILARSKAGTLQLDVDDVGLRFNAELPDTSYARDIQASLARGDVDSMSFGFIPKADGWSRAENGRQVRTITDLDLFDVSIVPFPAYQGTDVTLRSLSAYDLGPATPDRPVRLIAARARLTITGEH